MHEDLLGLGLKHARVPRPVRCRTQAVADLIKKAAKSFSIK
jgi:hypothetical protein